MNPNDPKVTAFLLGEKEGLTPEDLREVEALLAGDREGEEIRKAVGLLREGFSWEPLPRLRDDQREILRKEAEILSAPEAAEPSRPSRGSAGGRESVWAWLRYPLFWAPAMAAFLLALFGLPWSGPFSPPQESRWAARAQDSAIATVEANAGSTSPPVDAASPLGSPEALPLDVRARFEETRKALSSNEGSELAGRLGRRRMPAWAMRDRAAGLSLGATGGSAYSEPAVPILGAFYEGARQGEVGEADRRKPGDRNSFDAVDENRFLLVADHPLSTFGIDVDTASYRIVRRYLLEEKKLPPKGAVRIEQLVNYFPYDYPSPQGTDPFGVGLEAASCPWAPKHRLVRIGIKAKELPPGSAPPSNLVFLVDLSRSTNEPGKLPLLQKSLDYLVDQLGERDQVEIVYAGASSCVLLPTGDKKKIREAIAGLRAGGPTDGDSGIEMAYELAEKNFLKDGNNRVILATDGDGNVGATSRSELLDRIAEKARKKIYLTVLGFGMGDRNDSMLVKLADRGKGNYAYIDTLEEAHRVFGEALRKTLFLVAEDVKLQVEFNPRTVSAYRLLGYEKRGLAKEEFNDDAGDAGAVGAGQTVTVLYEIIPAEEPLPPHPEVDPLRYRSRPKEADRGSRENATRTELLTVKIRYKRPDEETSRRWEFPLTDSGEKWEKSSEEFRFSAAVAAFGERLRNSPFQGECSWKLVTRLAEGAMGKDSHGYRSSFLRLVKQAASLEGRAHEESGEEE